MTRPISDSCAFSTGSGVGKHSKPKEACKEKKVFIPANNICVEEGRRLCNQQVKLLLFHLDHSEDVGNEHQEINQDTSHFCTRGVETEQQQDLGSTAHLALNFGSIKSGLNSGIRKQLSLAETQMRVRGTFPGRQVSQAFLMS